MGRVSEHNQDIRMKAEYRAREMRFCPSPLEERMKKVLDDHYIDYEFQKIFYIYADDGWIIRYYIADFFIPDKDIIIEVDGKFHEHRKIYDRNRTEDIQDNYPEVEVLRYTWEDVSDEYKMSSMIRRIRW